MNAERLVAGEGGANGADEWMAGEGGGGANVRGVGSREQLRWAGLMGVVGRRGAR